MNFELEQSKLVEMFERLMLVNVFPSSVISTTTDGTLFSIQKDSHARALRFIKFNKGFFKSIDGKDETVEIDVEKALKLIKAVPPKEVLKVNTEGNKFVIVCKKKKIHLTTREPEDEIIKGLPFETVDGVPVIGEGVDEVKLDVNMKIKLDDFKAFISDASPLKTEYYTFCIKNKKINVRVGDLHDTSDDSTWKPDGEIFKGEKLNAIYTFGVQQIGDTFREDVNIKLCNEAPAWFYEENDDYMFGVLLPPYVEEEE